jgi:AcrR family transcriptional regulator
MTANVAARRRKKEEGAEAAVPPAEVKERIRTAALTLFGQKGYVGVSVRQICRLAETTPPMVYYYYGSKRGLYESILRESIYAQRAQLREALREKGDCLVRLRKVVEAWLGIGNEPVVRELRLFFLRELFGLGSDMYKRSVENTDRSLRHAVKEVIQDGIEQGVFRPVRAEMAALAIVGIVNTFMRRMALGAPLTLEDCLEQVMDSFVLGLARDRASRAEGA